MFIGDNWNHTSLDDVFQSVLGENSEDTSSEIDVAEDETNEKITNEACVADEWFIEVDYEVRDNQDFLRVNLNARTRMNIMVSCW